MLRGGRPRDPIWQHFYLLEDGDKKSAQCKKCLRLQSIKACRMKTHYEKCSATAIVKQPDSNVPEKLAATTQHSTTVKPELLVVVVVSIWASPCRRL